MEISSSLELGHKVPGMQEVLEFFSDLAIYHHQLWDQLERCSSLHYCICSTSKQILFNYKTNIVQFLAHIHSKHTLLNQKHLNKSLNTGKGGVSHYMYICWSNYTRVISLDSGMIVTFSKKRIYLSSLLYHFVKSTEIYLKWERFQRRLFTACGVIMNQKNYLLISYTITFQSNRVAFQMLGALGISAIALIEYLCACRLTSAQI